MPKNEYTNHVRQYTKDEVILMHKELQDAIMMTYEAENDDERLRAKAYAQYVQNKWCFNIGR